MRRFLFSSSIISALFGGWGTIQATRKGPRDWRLILMWVSWAATLAIAIGTVAKNADDLGKLGHREEE